MQPGDIIELRRGRYVLATRLAQSSYGVVWAAAGPAGHVAVKLVNRERMAQAAPHQHACWTGCARNELAFLESLSPWDGRHIVRLLDSGQHHGLPAMALERMDGDLARYLAAHGPLPFGQVMGWMAQVNQALARVHQYGWRYLDLKPANLLVNRAGSAIKLADFGTGRLLADAAPHEFTGTASWLAPEQAIPHAPGRYLTDRRTDYFALGALFYYLASGGATLRFCGECGDAYREHGLRAAAILRTRHGRGPLTLHDDEARLFERRLAAQLAWRDRGLAGRALLLLRSLVAADPSHRPAHAVAISRALDELRTQPAPSLLQVFWA